MEIHRLLYEQLTSITQGRVGLPRLIHYDGDLRMLLSVWIDPPLEGTVIRPEDLARSAAETLLALQATSLPGLKLVDSFKRRQALERWHRCIEHLRPGLAERAATLIAALAEAQDALPTQMPVVVHNDYYEAQLVTTPTGTILLDLDTLAMGDREIDLGNFLAHLRLWAFQRLPAVTPA